MKLVLFLTILLSCFTVKAEEICSREADVNYQKILVDMNSTEKGEGLRFYLEKDDVAKLYLDEYQKGTETNWINAAVGTSGTLLLLNGVLEESRLADGRKNKKRVNYIYGGAAILLINLFLAKTFEYQNEVKLKRSIEEYNKRNAPKINFDPLTINEEKNTNKPSIFFAKSWSF